MSLPTLILTPKKVRCAYDSERYALRAADVDIGDIVYVDDTGKWWLVSDTSALNSDAGYDNIHTDAAAETFANITVTGQALFGSGTEALPSLAFIGKTGTGMWKDSSDQIAFSIAGGRAVTIGTTGNLLVGSLAVDSAIGVIQLPQAGANLSLWGIRWGTDVNTYRSGSSGFTIDATGGVISTGVFSAPNGTTLLPSFAFTSDRTAGMLYAGSGGVKIATSATQAVLFSGVDQSAQFSGRVVGTTALNGFNIGGTVTPFCELEVDSTASTSPRGIMSAQFSNDTGGARLHMRKARGTRAAPTTVVTGDNLGRLVGTGYDGTNYLEMASIYFASEGTIAATRVPTNIQFWTATDAAPSVLTEAMRITSNQNVLIGTTTNGTGRIQLPNHSAASGGVTLGTGLNLFAQSSGGAGLVIGSTNSSLYLTNSGGTQVLTARTGGASGVDLGEVAGTSGSLRLYSAQTVALTLDASQNATFAGKAVSTSATAGIGYATGAGGTVTQATDKTTTVVLNKVCGQITMNGAALGAGTIVNFTLTNSAIAATDVIHLQHQGTGTPGAYTINAISGTGSATIYVRNNTAGSLSEAIVLSFVVVKAVTA